MHGVGWRETCPIQGHQALAQRVAGEPSFALVGRQRIWRAISSLWCVITQQRRLFMASTILHMPVRRWLRHFVAKRESLVVEALGQQYYICQGVIYCKNDLCFSSDEFQTLRISVAYHSWQHTLQDGAEDVEDVARKPYHDKHHRKTLRRAPTDVFEDLRRKDNNPACN